MKKILILVIVMMSVFANAQFKRFTNARITLNDGTVKKGLAKIIDLQLGVKFKEKKGAEKEFFDFKEIKSISIVEMGDVVNYEVKYKTKKTTPIANNTNDDDDDDDDDDDWGNDEYDNVRMPYLFEVVIKGKVSLYAIYHYQNPAMTVNNMTTLNGIKTTDVSTPYVLLKDKNAYGTSITYYLSKENEDYVTTIAYIKSINVGKSFEKKAIEYFSDCPELVQKIKAKVFRKRDIEEIVKYYNSNCER